MSNHKAIVFNHNINGDTVILLSIRYKYSVFNIGT